MVYKLISNNKAKEYCYEMYAMPSINSILYWFMFVSL